MTRRPATRQQVARAIAAIEAIGKPVAAVSVHKDGTITVRIGDPLDRSTESRDDAEFENIIAGAKHGQNRHAN